MIRSPYAPELVTPADAPLLTRDEAKLQCRVELDDTFEDDLIDGLIRAATAYLDGYSGVLGRCLINQTWLVKFDTWAPCFRLPFPNVSGVVVKWVDDAGSETVVDAASYRVLEDATSAYLRFSDSYGAPSGVATTAGWSVALTTGYGADASTVPDDIRLAAKMLVAHFYNEREGAVLPAAVDILIAPYRRVWL